MRQVGCVHSGETSCLSMRVGGHVGWYFSVPARIPMGSADAWVQDWWTHVTSVSPMTNGPSANVLGHTCAISVRSATVPGHVGPFRVLCLGPGLLYN